MAAFRPTVFLNAVFSVIEVREDVVRGIPGFPAMIVGIAPDADNGFADLFEGRLIQLDDADAKELRPTVVHEQTTGFFIV